jgi:hypothetical protein
VRRLTFELTPRAEAGLVSPGCDDSTTGADRAYKACRSESGVERGVSHHFLRRGCEGADAGEATSRQAAGGELTLAQK